MERALYVLSILVLLTTAVMSQDTPKSDEDAIRETVMDYAEGFYEGSANRLRRALSPDLIKLSPARLSDQETTVLNQSTYSELMVMARTKVGFQPEEARNIQIEIMEISGMVAQAKLTSSQFNDYIQLVKSGSLWKIVNVLWIPGEESRNRAFLPDLEPEEQKIHIEQAARNWIEGVYSGQPMQVSQALHPRYTESSWTQTPPFPQPMLRRQGSDFIIGLAEAQMAMRDPSRWNFSIDVLDIMGGLAIARLSDRQTVSYIHLVYMGGAWKMVHCFRTSRKS